jgi:hypothetical protein
MRERRSGKERGKCPESEKLSEETDMKTMTKRPLVAPGRFKITPKSTSASGIRAERPRLGDSVDGPDLKIA